MTLTSVLVALAIGGVAAVLIASLFRTQSDGLRKAQDEAERLGVRTQIFAEVDCLATLPMGACVPNANVALRRIKRDGTLHTVVAPTAQRFGRWAVRSRCNATGDGLDVRMALLRPGAAFSSTNPSDYRPSATTRVVTTFADAGSLMFPAGVDVCGGRPSFTRECLRTTLDPLAGPGPPSNRTFAFTAAECGGLLPDANYVCSLASMEVCGNEDSWNLTQPTATSGPRVTFRWKGGCGGPAGPSNIHAVCIREVPD